MTVRELDKRYQPAEIESRWYEFWEKGGHFRPASDRTGKSQAASYVVVIPPPNVTGILHMGHALNNTIQDVLVRWNRMRGRDTLWVPGVDHAGIATQNVVEKKLAKQKKTRHELGRAEFLKEVWKWKEEHGSTITRQLRRLGASCDWSRERFTMDEGLSRAVREAFVTLHEKGLIYQGNYIINWCPRCQTALSDEEAPHKETEGALYHIRYTVLKNDGSPSADESVVVATTRPETMLGDTAVAVHPEDSRYKHLVGKNVMLPLMNRPIPVVADSFVDPAFGTGIVKVTPAHDPNDFEMGRRHNLEQINILRPDGVLNENAGSYAGLDRFEARKRVLEDLERLGFFVRRDSHLHAVGRCYRCDTVVEPFLSKQLFVRMKPLAEKALAAQSGGKIRFYPARWTKVYTNWLDNIRDWCISRQIWWGHQVPVWYCDACLEKGKKEGVIVSRTEPKQCPACGGPLRQDPDVLDTWFSSWLWPFSTLGWPDKTADLRRFYPTSDLVTASEIIFFWVARMIMSGLEFMGEVPFSRVLIHGTVRAEGGLKMSKSLGNSIDPLEVIDEMGADALRFSIMMAAAQDVYLSREKFEVGRNFTNKVWNAARYALMNAGEGPVEAFRAAEPARETLLARWMLSRLAAVNEAVGRGIESFSLSQACIELYHFVWNDFCDWFIELSKASLNGPDADESHRMKGLLVFTLDRICRLLHPFMPFVTEEIWSRVREISPALAGGKDCLAGGPWPETPAAWRDEGAEFEMDILQRAISAVRELRSRLNIPPSQKLDAVVHFKAARVKDVLGAFDAQIRSLARLENLSLEDEFSKNAAFLGLSFADMDVFVRIEGLVDPARERAKIEKKAEETRAWAEAIAKKLANENFVSHAPMDVVERERQKLDEARRILQSYESQLSLFS